MIYGQAASGRAWTQARGRLGARKLDTDDSPLALWLMGDLTDSSGNGITLTQASGSSRWTQAYGLTGLIEGVSSSRAESSSASLRLTGAMSCIWQGLLGQDIGTSHPLVICTGNGETEATNTLWQITIDANGSPAVGHEYGAGTNQSLAAASWIVPVNTLVTLGFTRSSGGTHKIFCNGQLAESGSLTAPSGGSSALTYFGYNGSTTYYPATTLSCGVYSSELSEERMRVKMLRMLGYDP